MNNDEEEARKDIERLLAEPPRTDPEVNKSAFNRVIGFIKSEDELTDAQKEMIIKTVEKYRDLQ